MLVEGDVYVKHKKEIPEIGELITGEYPDGTKVDCIVKEYLALQWKGSDLMITVLCDANPNKHDLKRYMKERFQLLRTKEE